MTKIRAYNASQDQFGKEQAQTLAEFVESQDGPDLGRFSTKEDIGLLKEDIQLLRQDMKDLGIRLIKDMAKNREDINSRMNWTAVIQVLSTIGALAALAKFI